MTTNNPKPKIKTNKIAKPVAKKDAKKAWVYKMPEQKDPTPKQLKKAITEIDSKLTSLKVNTATTKELDDLKAVFTKEIEDARQQLNNKIDATLEGASAAMKLSTDQIEADIKSLALESGAKTGDLASKLQDLAQQANITNDRLTNINNLVSVHTTAITDLGTENGSIARRQLDTPSYGMLAAYVLLAICISVAIVGFGLSIGL